MMTKKRTSALANMKLFIVVPVIGLVFLAISAYKEMPDPPEQQIVDITLPQSSSLTSDISTTKTTSNSLLKPSTPSRKSPSSETRSETVLPPAPPPPPSEAVKKEIKEKPVVEQETNPFVIVEEMPMFPGGDTELLKYIASNTQYPEAAKVNNIQGKVIVRFCVTAEGGVNRISVLKGVDPDLDAEAVRVVKTLPAFNPGKQGGKAVPVWYMVPITFTMK